MPPVGNKTLWVYDRLWFRATRGAEHGSEYASPFRVLAWTDRHGLLMGGRCRQPRSGFSTMSLSNRIELAKDGTRVIGLDSAGVWKQLNRAAFLFQHTLANHPLFDIPRLLTLAKGVIDRGDPTKFGLTVAGDAKFNSAPWHFIPDGARPRAIIKLARNLPTVSIVPKSFT
jgi:hypothetical protein